MNLLEQLKFKLGNSCTLTDEESTFLKDLVELQILRAKEATNRSSPLHQFMNASLNFWGTGFQSQWTTAEESHPTKLCIRFSSLLLVFMLIGCFAAIRYVNVDTWPEMMTVAVWLGMSVWFVFASKLYKACSFFGSSRYRVFWVVLFGFGRLVPQVLDMASKFEWYWDAFVVLAEVLLCLVQGFIFHTKSLCFRHGELTIEVECWSLTIFGVFFEVLSVWFNMQKELTYRTGAVVICVAFGFIVKVFGQIWLWYIYCSKFSAIFDDFALKRRDREKRGSHFVLNVLTGKPKD